MEFYDLQESRKKGIAKTILETDFKHSVCVLYTKMCLQSATRHWQLTACTVSGRGVVPQKKSRGSFKPIVQHLHFKLI